MEAERSYPQLEEDRILRVGRGYMLPRPVSGDGHVTHNDMLSAMNSRHDDAFLTLPPTDC